MTKFPLHSRLHRVLAAGTLELPRHAIDFEEISNAIAGKVYISSKMRDRLSRAYDQSVRSAIEPFDYLKEIRDWHGPPVWSQRKNLSSPNYFYWDFYSMHGSLEVPWNQEARDSLTFGGGCWDGMLGLKQYDREYRTCHRMTDGEFSSLMKDFLLDVGSCTPLDPDSYPNEIGVKTEANPGPTFISNGIRDKATAVRVSMSWLRAVVEGELSINDIPPILWGLGGRGKPTTIKKLSEKKAAGKPVGRSIWMADAHETVFAWRYQQPLTALLSKLSNGIDIGVNFKSPEGEAMMKEFLSEIGIYIGGDWNNFDASLLPNLISDAFKLLRLIFNISKDSIDDEILSWLEDSLVYSRVVCPDRKVYQKKGGLASGSGLTSIIGSLCNLIILWRATQKWNSTIPGKLTPCTGLRVLGDDNLTRFRSENLNEKSRRKIAKMIVGHLVRFGYHHYGMVLHPDKTTFSTDPFVKFLVPKVYEKVSDHSRKYMREHPVYVKERGEWVVAKGLKQYRVVRSWAEVEYARKHFSKRYSYFFTGAIKYLGNYYLPDGGGIRSRGEAMNRLGTTSAVVKNVYQWRALVAQYLMEFWNNLSARNTLMCMFADSFYMEKEGIITSLDALNNIALVESGKKRYEARDYILSHIGKRTDSSTRNGRGWWIAQADWWPDFTDKRFFWIKDQLKALYICIAKLKQSGGPSMGELYRIRPLLLGEYQGRGISVGKVSGSIVKSFLETWSMAIHGISNYVEPFPMEWEPKPEEKALAVMLVPGLEDYIFDRDPVAFDYAPMPSYQIDPVDIQSMILSL